MCHYADWVLDFLSPNPSTNPHIMWAKILNLCPARVQKTKARIWPKMGWGGLGSDYM